MKGYLLALESFQDAPNLFSLHWTFLVHPFSRGVRGLTRRSFWRMRRIRLSQPRSRLYFLQGHIRTCRRFLWLSWDRGGKKHRWGQSAQLALARGCLESLA